MDSLISTFGIQWSSLIGYAVDFFILFFVLKKFTYKPLLKYLNERKTKIENDAKISAEIALRKEQMNKEYSETIKKAQSESEMIIQKAREIATQMEEKIVASAHEEAEKVGRKMQKQITEEKESMYNALKSEMLKLVVEATKKVIKEELPLEKQEKIIRQSISEYEKGSDTKA